MKNDSTPLDINADDVEAYKVLAEYLDKKVSKTEFYDAYLGYFDSKEKFARSIYNKYYNLSGCTVPLLSYSELANDFIKSKEFIYKDTFGFKLIEDLEYTKEQIEKCSGISKLNKESGA